MKFNILLYLLSIILKIASWGAGSLGLQIRSKDAVLMIKTRDNRYSRQFIFKNNSFTSANGEVMASDGAMVWSDAGTAFKTMTSGYEGDFFKAFQRGKLYIHGNAEQVYSFISLLKEIKGRLKKGRGRME